ncbi:MAG: DUF3365 domain-containing protein [Planctomycetales bacterium]|nr:DUF3365 domain-containing protein [Planctomycetales bacterium]
MKATCVGVVCVLVSLGSIDTVSSDERTEANERAGLSLEDARDRAQVMHDVYAATLDVLHHRYFHRDRAIIPARAMQDIFDELERQSKTEARWISASMKPMSVDHEPASDFEKRAAKEIAAGTEQLEVVEDGYYRRAGAILLSDGCVGCHGGFFKPQSKKPKFAGLVISVPIRDSEPAESK